MLQQHQRLDFEPTITRTMPVPCSRKVRVGKKDCAVDTFIGAPYGAVYQLDEDGKTLRRCARQAHVVMPGNDQNEWSST